METLKELLKCFGMGLIVIGTSVGIIIGLSWVIVNYSNVAFVFIAFILCSFLGAVIREGRSLKPGNFP
jgi:hypothetical protein